MVIAIDDLDLPEENIKLEPEEKPKLVTGSSHTQL